MAKIAPETSDTMTMGRTVPLPVVGEASPLVVVVVAFGFVGMVVVEPVGTVSPVSSF